jgi:hypothetical protein
MSASLLRGCAPLLAAALVMACRQGDTGASASVQALPSVLEPSRAATEADATPAQPPKQCVVFLHGKSGHGEPILRGPVYSLVRPNGNAEGWGGRQWIYFPEPRYAEVRASVARAIDDSGCTRVILHGFSNGGGLAAKLYCRGEDFGGKVRGYVIDDPVVDHGVDSCRPRAGKGLRLYWTGGLSKAKDGWDCKGEDWTCEGDSTIGIDRYAAKLGVKPTPSRHTKHAPYDEPPDYARWW